MGIRAFSAIATKMNANSPSPSDTRRPTDSVERTVATVESWVVPATSATVKTMSSIAGSASDAIIISREEPRPPKAVPTSMPASARVKRAVPSRATMAIRSADHENRRPVAYDGTSAAATHVEAKMIYGALR